MPESISDFQEYMVELYEEYRRQSRSRNPSDAGFAKWLGVSPGALTNYTNNYRKPDLSSAIRISQSLGRHGVKDHMRIFDVLHYPRIWIAPNSEIEYIIEFWHDLPGELKAEIGQAIQNILEKGKQ